MTMSVVLGVAVVATLLVGGVRPELAEQECPDDCDCHYFRVNWVTDCSENNLTAVPTPEDGLSLQVYILNMNGNDLKDLEPFPAEIKLRRLQLADNQLTRVTRESFAGLGYLLDLDLSGNRIATVDPEAFKDSPGLITLEMQTNPLVHVEGPFLFSMSLHYLDLSDCQLSKLTPQFFANITALNRLDLSGNPLRVLEAGILDPLNSLEYLKLNRCNLTHIAGQAFAHMEHLKELELSENSLKGPVDWSMVLGHLGRLERLDLRRSGISNLPQDAFVHNTWLRSLILAENGLRDLDVGTSLGHNLGHLDFLDLSHCNLKGPLSEDAFSNATKLRTLLLDGNPLSAADLAVALAPLTRLQKLSLRNCSLTRLPANTFHRFNCLQELDISRNPLNNAFTALLSPLESLEHLDMGYSNLARISRTTFSKMTALKTLILSGNIVKSLESGLFQNLTHLETLEMNNCGLSRLNATVFYDNFTYPDLEELRLAGNPLRVPAAGSFLPRQLSRLRTLDLTNCNLTHIPPEALNSFGNISKLLLSNNRLSNNSENAMMFLNKLSRLEVLDMSLNNLTHITPAVFKHNPNIMSLKLGGNPWKCGCNIVDMWEWAQMTKGDLGVLVGSLTAPEDIKAGGSKRKKALLCHFDSKTAPIREIAYKKPRKDPLNNVNRTWARYVRESACDSSRRIRPARLISSRQVRDVKMFLLKANRKAQQEGPPRSWVMVMAGVATVLLIGTALLVTRNKLRPMFRKIPHLRVVTSPVCTDEEDNAVAFNNSDCHALRRVSIRAK